MCWKHLKVGKKLLIGFGSILILVALLSMMGFNWIQRVGHSLFVLVNEETWPVDMAMKMKVSPTAFSIFSNGSI